MTLEELAKTYYAKYANRSVRLDLLMAYIFQEHNHSSDDKNPVVDSIELEKWVIQNANNIPAQEDV